VCPVCNHVEIDATEPMPFAASEAPSVTDIPDTPVSGAENYTDEVLTEIPLEMPVGGADFRAPVMVEEEVVAEEFVDEAPLEVPVDNTTYQAPVEVQEETATEDVVTEEFVDEAPLEVPVDNTTYQAPVEVQEETATEDVVPEAPAKPKKRILKTILSVFMTMLFFIFLTSSLFIYNVRTALNQKRLENVLNNIDVFDAMEEMGVDYEEKMADVRHFMSNSLAIDMTEDNMRNIVENSTAQEFLAEKISEFSDSFLSEGKAKFSIKHEEISQLITDNRDVIYEETGQGFTPYDVEKTADRITKGKDMLQFNVDISDSENSLPYNLIYFGFSYISLAILLILSIMLVVFMLKNSLRQAFMGIGIAFTIYSIPVLLIWLFTAVLPGILGTIFGDAFFGNLIGSIISFNGIIAASLLGIAIILFIVRRFLPKR